MGTPAGMIDDVLDPTDTPAPRPPDGSSGPGATAQEAIEDCFARGWTDGLPVVPCTEERVREFLAQTSREPEDVVVAMKHLNRQATVREVAVNAVMAGCLPEYFPVVLAAWDSLNAMGIGRSALWQSTTGTAPFLLVNGPVVDTLEINNAGNVFGSGFRANATIGRTIRLTTLNVFGLRPHLLDQATQASPAKYTCCIGENVAASPWPSYHEERGFRSEESTVTATLVRGTLYIEARHTSEPEHLLADLVDSAARTGRLVGDGGHAWAVLSPEHAALLGNAGWSKDDVKRFMYEHSARSAEDLDRVGKGAVSSRTGWRVPRDHPDAVDAGREGTPLHVLRSAEAVEVFVAGADNAGVSTIVETAGGRAGRCPITKVEVPPS